MKSFRSPTATTAAIGALTLSEGAARRIRDLVLTLESVTSAVQFEAALASSGEFQA